MITSGDEFYKENHESDLPIIRAAAIDSLAKVAAHYEAQSGLVYSPMERAVARRLIDIWLETEFMDEFKIPNIMATSNDSVMPKLMAIRRINQLVKFLNPADLGNHNLDLTIQNLETAPWVNKVHCLARVLNWMNAIDGLQKIGVFNPRVIFGIARELYRGTMEYHDGLHLRDSGDFLQGGFYLETFYRTSGVKGVNTERYVTTKELLALLSIVRIAFAKQQEGTITDFWAMES